MKQIYAIYILTVVCFLLKKPLNNGPIVKISDRSSILLTIHRHLVLLSWKDLFSKFVSKGFLTLSHLLLVYILSKRVWPLSEAIPRKGFYFSVCSLMTVGLQYLDFCLLTIPFRLILLFFSK